MDATRRLTPLVSSCYVRCFVVRRLLSVKVQAQVFEPADVIANLLAPSERLTPDLIHLLRIAAATAFCGLDKHSLMPL
jgi:hypothetical protein